MRSPRFPAARFVASGFVALLLWTVGIDPQGSPPLPLPAVARADDSGSQSGGAGGKTSDSGETIVAQPDSGDATHAATAQGAHPANPPTAPVSSDSTAASNSPAAADKPSEARETPPVAADRKSSGPATGSAPAAAIDEEAPARQEAAQAEKPESAAGTGPATVTAAPPEPATGTGVSVAPVAAQGAPATTAKSAKTPAPDAAQPATESGAPESGTLEATPAGAKSAAPGSAPTATAAGVPSPAPAAPPPAADGGAAGAARAVRREPTADLEQPAAPALPTEDDWHLLMAARHAALSGRLDEAAARYCDLIRRDPRNFTAFGELGNLRYGQRQWRAAGRAYAAAVLRLVDLGEARAAWRLLPLIRRLDTASGARVAERLRSIGLPPPRAMAPRR